jgi:hypothetical protein
VAESARSGLRFLDRHPTPLVVGLFGGGMLVSYSIVAAMNGESVLVGAEAAATRSNLFSSLAATSGALLGFAITSVSVLLALPDRESIERLRGFRAWRLLTQGLLVAAGLLAVTLIYATVALATDTGPSGNDWLEIPLVSFAVASITELVVTGIAFALVVVEAARAP